MLHLLTDKQRKNLVIVSSDLQGSLCKPCCSCWRPPQVMKHGFMCMILKQRSLSSLCLKSTRQIYSSVKTYRFIFQHLWNHVYKFILQEQTVNQHFNLDILCCVQEDVWQESHEKWYAGNWFIQFNNYVAHLLVCVNFLLRIL